MQYKTSEQNGIVNASIASEVYVRPYRRSRPIYLPILMLWRKVQESTYIDATVIGVHGDRDLLYLEAPDQEDLRVIPCPPKYERPCNGDCVKLELRLELRPGRKRRSWQTYIIRFPGERLDRENIHDITDYDS